MLSRHFYPYRPALSPSPPACSPPNGNPGSQHPPSPPLSVYSGESQKQNLVSRALEYINNRTSETPRLLLTGFSWADFDDFEKELKHPRRISERSAESLRYDYNPETFVLRISGMPAGAHNELEYFIHSCLTLLLYHRFIDLAEYKQIDVGWSSAFILPGRATTPQIGRKPPAVAKVPDCYIGLRDKGESWFPRVVFEVGFSQSYEEVRDDAYQWLVRSDGGIPLVVLIKIEEHPIPAPPPDDDPQSDDSADSDVAIYRRLRAACDVDSLVGPISAFAELYRYGPAGVYLDGDRINIISPPDVVPPAPAGQILLSITDLLPHIVDDRVISFDLAEYADGLRQQARGKMVNSRIVAAREKRREAAGITRSGDADYQPGT